MAGVVSQEPPVAVPKRFQTAKATLIIDRLMTHFITVGGISVIVAVLGIFVFILLQVVPLFQGARVEALQSVQLPGHDYAILAVDEWSELPILVTRDGALLAVDLAAGGQVRLLDAGFDTAKILTAFSYKQQQKQLLVATQEGEFALVDLHYQLAHAHDTRAVVAQPRVGKFLAIGQPGFPITHIAYGDGGDQKIAAALQNVNGTVQVHAVRLVQKRSMLGAGETRVEESYDLSSQIVGRPQAIQVNARADAIVVATREGQIFYFYRDGDELRLRQTLAPFQDRTDPTITSMDFLFGGVSLVLTNPQGVNRIFSLYIPPGETTRVFGHIKSLPALPSGASFYAGSLRNKAFLTGIDSLASLRYGTTATTRWEQSLPFRIQHAVMSEKYDRMLFLDSTGRLHVYGLRDPHPEAGVRALFGKIWYEGTAAPSYTWQSAGASDDFEAKLSLVPLIVGTFKGTCYAMLFAVPIALLAAIYTSQFLHPNLRTMIKPTMEIMASLPSVILGFLAALWLAPLLETRIPAFLLAIVLIPLAAMLFGSFWSALSIHSRRWIKPGHEFLAAIPLLLLAVYAAWALGPLLERLVFVVDNPATGQAVADFRLWWPQATGASFEQRNSLVVGFIMGFAVIPIVFTITEDSLSNVPAALTSASLALGASRWQTAMRVVLPTASAGIFSALMIGLGRAVGETMIVLMATGNTPIMDLNIFSGMRTLSANIAVELPEAPHNSTLYRTLFLGGMVLFLITFVMNTLAEMLRQRLRERYKTV